jgi:ABC-2 type transport system permease protein
VSGIGALARAELQRATSRRLVRVFMLLSIVGAIAVGVVSFTQTSSADGKVIAARIESAHRVEDQQRKALIQCLYDESHAGKDVGRKDCQEPARAHVGDPRLHRQKVNDLLKGAGGILALIAWVIGASLMGAEQQSRSITTTLTFAPRRNRVFATKAAVAVGVAAAWALATLSLVLAALLPAAILHGAPALGEPGNLAIAGVILRGVGLAAITATMGFALASIGRNTAAALGVGFAYILVIENILGDSIAGWRRWLLLGNVIVFVTGKTTSDVAGRSVVGAAIFLVAIAGGLLVASGTLFRTRDVA